MYARGSSCLLSRLSAFLISVFCLEVVLGEDVNRCSIDTFNTCAFIRSSWYFLRELFSIFLIRLISISKFLYCFGKNCIDVSVERISEVVPCLFCSVVGDSALGKIVCFYFG